MATSTITTRRAFINLIPALGFLAAGAATASPAQASQLTTLIAEHWSIYSQLEDMCGKSDPADPAYDATVADMFDELATAEYRAREALFSHPVDTLEAVREKLAYMTRPDVELHKMMTEGDVQILLGSFA
jgi:hypothetical protein